MKKTTKGYRPYTGRNHGCAFVTAVLCFLVIAVIAIILSTKAGAISWTSKQVKAHEIAEIARDMGLPEDDPIIIRAKEIWADEKKSLTYLGKYSVTGYDPLCAHCCGKADGITASGEKAVCGVTAAMKDIPFGTRIYIDGMGEYVVQDRGVGDGVIDVACDGHEACYAVTGYRAVYIIE